MQSFQNKFFKKAQYNQKKTKTLNLLSDEHF